MDDELVADAIAAENVRLLIAGALCGYPIEGTLAWRVWNTVALFALHIKGLP